jgi:hypothetical protein
VILKIQKFNQKSSSKSATKTHECISVGRPTDSNTNSQKDDAERHVDVAAVSSEVNAD